MLLHSCAPTMSPAGHVFATRTPPQQRTGASSLGKNVTLPSSCTCSASAFARLSLGLRHVVHSTEAGVRLSVSEACGCTPIDTISHVSQVQSVSSRACPRSSAAALKGRDRLAQRVRERTCTRPGVPLQITLTDILKLCTEHSGAGMGQARTLGSRQAQLRSRVCVSDCELCSIPDVRNQ